MRIKIGTNMEIGDPEYNIDILPPLGTLIFLNEFYDIDKLEKYFEGTDINYEDLYRLRSCILSRDEKGIYYYLIFELDY